MRDRHVVALAGVVIVACSTDGQLRTHAVDPGRVSSGVLLDNVVAHIESSLDAWRERPVDDALTDRVARKARPGTVSLGLAATQVDIYALSAALAPLGGEVADTTLSVDDELKLVEAISNARDDNDGNSGNDPPTN
ncbi:MULTISPECIES: DUF1269 domain-containing protein [Burkholderia]|uniref:DUF1269 domain-containing protein n=1 Tax=Burkholderia TaxID=32008 RepID=UPI000A8AF72C|nr:MULTISPECIES: DUF1269 domain-containing protein [Burkholderia]CAG2374221.1 membrane protein [Burkholderia cenocepacia]CAG2374355.1 membrane protein [Burkholderia cenocepacia]CAG2374358.1 membrane protein [Burkholderia cenocepacia]CAG2374462.1 membrane protein [Burkholderia cenocepacia]CAG2374472.1 membrane protein [Burkholderia cenocepacia]